MSARGVRRFVLGGAAAAALLVAGATSFSSWAGAAFFDSDLDGVWVGVVSLKSNAGTREIPVLINLDADPRTARAALLWPADLVSAADDYSEAATATGAIKGKKLTLTVARADGPVSTLVLRNKRGALRGTLTSTDPRVNKSKVVLQPAGLDAPVQHFWIGTVTETANRAALPAAFAVLDGKKPSGAGFVGDAVGTLKRIVIDGDDLTATLDTQDGDIDIEATRKNNALTGTVAGAVRGRLAAAAGGADDEGRITKVTPTELTAGRTTTLTITGRNLSPATLLHFDVAGVVATPLESDNGKKATTDVFVPEGVPFGTRITAQVVSPNGATSELTKPLTSSGVAEVSFTNDIEPIFLKTCAQIGCHSQPPLDDPAYEGVGPAGDMILDDGRGYGNIVNTPSFERPELNRITPGDPDNSYLIMKLRGSPGIIGDRMPAGGPFLSAEVIDMFVRWVNEGARRN